MLDDGRTANKDALDDGVEVADILVVVVEITRQSPALQRSLSKRSSSRIAAPIFFTSTAN